MFIGRKQELFFLEDKYKSKGGQLVVLYGRRRVGKTETLREFCKGKPHVFFSCREVSDKLQLCSFSEKLLHEKIPASNYITEFADWESAFKSVIDLPYKSAKRLLVISLHVQKQRERSLHIASPLGRIVQRRKRHDCALRKRHEFHRERITF